MKVFKRPLSILLTLLMLVSMVPLATFTASAVTIVDSSSSYVNLDANNATSSANYDATGVDFRDWHQRDHRWNYYALGASSSADCNFGHAGCTVTSIAKVMIEAGLATPTELDPGKLVRYLNNNESFSGSNLLWDGPENFAKEVLGKYWWYRSTNVFTSTAGSNSDYTLLKNDMTGSKTYTSDLCGENDMTSARAAAMLNYMFRFSGTGYHQIITEDTTGYNLSNQRIRLSMMLQAGYHLLPNVHNDGTHWVAIDETATRNSGTTTETVTYNGETFTVETYKTFYVMNSWYGSDCDNTNSRDTLQEYLDTETGLSDSNRGKFVRVAAYSTNPVVMYSLTAAQKAKVPQINASSYAQSDEYKLWSNKDPRWAAGITSYPTTTAVKSITPSNTESKSSLYGETDNADSLIEMMGEWGQSIVALDKMLIQSGVKASTYLPADNYSMVPSSKEKYLTSTERGSTGNLLGDLHSNSLIGATSGVISWDSLKTLDSEKIKESGTAYSDSTSITSGSEAAKAMIENMRENGYHYIVNMVKGSIADNAWYAVDEEATLSDENTSNAIYGFSSNADTSTNASTALTGSAYKIYYFKTSPSYVPVTFSAVNADITATAGGKTINSGDYVKLGTEIVVTAAPNEDYKLDKWTVNSTDDTTEKKNTYTFTLAEETDIVYTAKEMTVVYLDATGNADGSNFTQSGDVWYAWTWADGEDGHYVASSGTTSSGYLKFKDVESNIKFVRANKTISDLTTWDSSSVNNQTGNLTTEADKVYSITGWDDNSGLHNLAGTWKNWVDNTVYLYPNAVSTNNNLTSPVNDVYTYAWTWNSKTDGHWIKGTLQDNGLIKFENVQNNIQFVRMDGSKTLPPLNNPGIGEYIWNATSDITVNTEANDLYVLDRFNGNEIYYYADNTSDIPEDNDYRYWTKDDPRWDGVRFGTSNDSTDLAGRYTLSQAIAKLAIQAGLRDASTWTVADCARDCYNASGLIDAEHILSGSGLTDYSNSTFSASITNPEISQAILDGYHLILRVNLKDGSGTEDVAVDEQKSLETNQIWVWRCTQEGELNSVLLNDIKGPFVSGNIRSFKGGTTPGLTRDFDYRRWSLYDGRWRNKVMTNSTRTMQSKGATVIAIAKMLVQAGVYTDSITPLDLYNFIVSDKGSKFNTYASLTWSDIDKYSDNIYKFAAQDTAVDPGTNEGYVYLKFEEPITAPKKNGESHTVTGYSRRTGTGNSYLIDDEKAVILEAIRQGYHMLLEVSKSEADESQTWFTIDEKKSLENDDVYIMNSSKDLSSNADITLTDAGYTYLFRVVGYKGATTPIAETVEEVDTETGDTITVNAVSLSADSADPAYIGTASDVASYVYGTTGDAVLTLKSASTAQGYMYCIADSETAAKAFESSVTVSPGDSAYSYSDGTVTISIADAFSTNNNGGTKYIAVKAVNGSTESNVVTASMTYDTVKLNTGFAKDSATNGYYAEIDRDDTYTLALQNELADGSSYASTVDVTPDVSAVSGAADAASKLTGLTFNGDTPGVYEFKINSASATVTKNGKSKANVPVTVTSNDEFIITVNVPYVDLTYYQNFTNDDNTVTTTEQAVKGGVIDSIPAAPDRPGYTFNGWFTERSGGTQVSIGTSSFSADTPLYAQWTFTGFVINFYETTSSSTPCYTVTVASGESIPEIEFYNATPDRGNGYVFKGWYDNNGQEVDINAAYTSSADLYAHWITVSDVEKSADDDNIISGSYSGYGLKGVQIREEGEDSNHQGEIMPGGLRFITSLSQTLLNEIDGIDGEVDGSNLEYGYAVTKKAYAEKFAEHFNLLDGGVISSLYKLKNCDSNVNGVNTNPSSGYTAENDYRYVTNVNCTSEDYDDNAASAHRKFDHKKYSDYRLYSLVITYEDEGESDKAEDIIARPYLKYTDANGLLRYRYDEYVGTSNVCGGCSVSYNQALTLAKELVDRQESD